MYKGNMRDFTEKLDDYLNREYDCRLVFGVGSNYMFVAFFTPDMMWSDGYAVYDDETFEQQIYDYINKELEDFGYVQRKYE